jgi:hypothetical protein
MKPRQNVFCWLCLEQHETINGQLGEKNNKPSKLVKVGPSRNEKKSQKKKGKEQEGRNFLNWRT